MKWILVALTLSIATLAFAGSATLSWTAPFDDSGLSKYDGRYSTTRPDTTVTTSKDTWWAAATVISVMPIPEVTGTNQTVTISPLGGGTYYFVVRSKDNFGNWSDWSNVATKTVVDTVGPLRIKNLQAR